MNALPPPTSSDQDEWERKCTSLVAELATGRDVAKQLGQLILLPHQSPPNSDGTTRKLLVKKIVASYENALFLLTHRMQPVQPDYNHPDPSWAVGPGGGHQVGTMVMMKSGSGLGSPPPPPSMSGSPRSEDSDRDGSPDNVNNNNNPSATRKRKGKVGRWTHKVKVSPGMGLEGPLDDGFTWRKYGQKDILGARYPRGYYRCTLRNVKGCLATKQVQRSDLDPSIFDITYRGRHTCSSAAQSNSPPPPPPPTQPSPAANNEQLLLTFRRGLKVITDDLDMDMNVMDGFFGSHHSTSPPPPPPYNNAPSSTAAASLLPTASSFMSFFPPPPLPHYSGCGSFPPHHHPLPSGESSVYCDGSFDAACSSVDSTPASAGMVTTVGLLGDELAYGNMGLFDSNYPTTTYGFDNSGFFS